MTENLLNLTIGSELKLDSLSDVVLNNLHSELIGYTQGESLIIGHPKKDDIPVQINSGERFMVGIEQGNDSVCFETEVVAVVNEPYPHLHTTYPVNVRSGSVRQSSRVSAAPANIHLIEDGAIDKATISIMNISTSGACLIVDKRLGDVNDMFQINFETGESELDYTFTCMIRYVHETHIDEQPMFSHGVIFVGMEAEAQLFIWKYFQESTALQSEASS